VCKIDHFVQDFLGGLVRLIFLHELLGLRQLLFVAQLFDIFAETVLHDSFFYPRLGRLYWLQSLGTLRVLQRVARLHVNRNVATAAQGRKTFLGSVGESLLSQLNIDGRMLYLLVMKQLECHLLRLSDCQDRILYGILNPAKFEVDVLLDLRLHILQLGHELFDFLHDLGFELVVVSFQRGILRLKFLD
jgi:hypothetical protein